MVCYIFSTFFLETKLSIQIRLDQFLFEVSRIGSHRDILKTLCIFNHAKTKIHWLFFHFHIPLGVRCQKIFFKKSEKKVDAHRNVQV